MSEPQETERLQFFMRSGNSFILDGVLDWEMKTCATGVSSLTLSQVAAGKATRLIVKSIDMAQIEAVLTLPALDEETVP